MGNELQVFNYEGNRVRAIVIDGDVWFSGKDIAEILGYKRTRDAIRDHVDERDWMVRRNLSTG